MEVGLFISKEALTPSTERKGSQQHIHAGTYAASQRQLKMVRKDES